MKDTFFIKLVLVSFVIYLLFQFTRIQEDNLPPCFTEEDHKTHVCCDSTHALCDGWCFCDGVGCIPYSETLK